MHRQRDNDIATLVPAAAHLVEGRRKHLRMTRMIRDFAADWQRWHALERLGAILLVGAAIATPMAVALAALVG
jgi:hypothetical protein